MGAPDRPRDRCPPGGGPLPPDGGARGRRHDRRGDSHQPPAGAAPGRRRGRPGPRPGLRVLRVAIPTGPPRHAPVLVHESGQSRPGVLRQFRSGRERAGLVLPPGRADRRYVRGPTSPHRIARARPRRVGPAGHRFRASRARFPPGVPGHALRGPRHRTHQRARHDDARGRSRPLGLSAGAGAPRGDQPGARRQSGRGPDAAGSAVRLRVVPEDPDRRGRMGPAGALRRQPHGSVVHARHLSGLHGPTLRRAPRRRRARRVVTQGRRSL
jgi:hypothetical protein